MKKHLLRLFTKSFEFVFELLNKKKSIEPNTEEPQRELMKVRVPESESYAVEILYSLGARITQIRFSKEKGAIKRIHKIENSNPVDHP